MRSLSDWLVSENLSRDDSRLLRGEVEQYSNRCTVVARVCMQLFIGHSFSS